MEAMTKIASNVFLWILLVSASCFAEYAPLEWSRRLALAEMERRGATLFKDGGPGARFDYTSGFFADALMAMGERTGDHVFTDFASKLVGSYVDAEGSIATYKASEFNLDMIESGKVLISLYEKSGDKRLEIAIGHLRDQLLNQPRTQEGGFWHKQRYPSQMWLDGIYMASPFLTRYGRVFTDPSAHDDAVKQILLVGRHTYDSKSGLFYHAWDEARTQVWADRESGRSPNFWGRSVGWYAMAIVDCLDDLPVGHRDAVSVREVLQRLADGLVQHQDGKTGLWWQVMDQGGREGNYLESSASCMFVYALAKAINHGYLSRENYLPVVRRGYEGLVTHFIRTDPNGALNLSGVCQVAGLGFKSANGTLRDGTYAYYVGEPVIENDLKGVAPFILAGLEVERLDPTVGWNGVAEILARIHAPEFAPRDFDITTFGARLDDNCTEAIRRAIAACTAAGGGRVVVPSGEWCTGAIHLQSNVNLYVAAGATLKFSTTPSDYPVHATRWEGVECMNYSALIDAFDQENVAVTGGGTLDGQADLTNWWGWNDKRKSPTLQQPSRDRLMAFGEAGVPLAERKFGADSFLRPNFIQFYRCKNILIEGVTIVRSPMWEIHPVLSQNCTIRGVVISSHGPNNDGCDPESCHDVLIEGCTFDTGDDCIAIKSGRNADGRRIHVPSENIVIRQCVMKDGHGGVVLGSEVSGGVRNVFIEDCQMDSPNLACALRVKSNAQRGGFIENIFMRHVKIGRVRDEVVSIDLLYDEGANGPYFPVVRNVNLEGISSDNSPRIMRATGFDGAIIDEIRIAHSNFRGLKGPDRVDHVGSIHWEAVTKEFSSK